MALRYQTTRGPLLRSVLNIIAPILCDANLTFDKTGITLDGFTPEVDVRLELPPSGSESIETWGEPVTLGLDLKNLAHWLRSVQAGNIIVFEITKAELLKPKPLMLYKQWNDYKQSEAKIPVLDIKQGAPFRRPTMYDAIVSFPAIDLDESLKQHGPSGDAVRFQVIDKPTGLLRIESQGLQVGASMTPCSFVEHPRSKKLAVAKPDLFAIKLLKMVSRAHTLNKNQQAVMSVSTTEKALVLTYNFSSGGLLEFRINPQDETIPGEEEDEDEKTQEMVSEAEDDEDSLVKKEQKKYDDKDQEVLVRKRDKSKKPVVAKPEIDDPVVKKEYDKGKEEWVLTRASGKIEVKDARMTVAEGQVLWKKQEEDREKAKKKRKKIEPADYVPTDPTPPAKKAKAFDVNAFMADVGKGSNMPPPAPKQKRPRSV